MPPSRSLLRNFNSRSEAQTLHRYGQYLFVASWRTMSFARKDSSNFIVRNASPGKFECALPHARSICEIGDRTHAHLDFESAASATTPDDAYIGDVMRAAIKNDLFHKAAQKRFALLVARSIPYLGQPASQG